MLGTAKTKCDGWVVAEGEGAMSEKTLLRSGGRSVDGRGDGFVYAVPSLRTLMITSKQSNAYEIDNRRR